MVFAGRPPAPSGSGPPSGWLAPAAAATPPPTGQAAPRPPGPCPFHTAPQTAPSATLGRRIGAQSRPRDPRSTAECAACCSSSGPPGPRAWLRLPSPQQHRHELWLEVPFGAELLDQEAARVVRFKGLLTRLDPVVLGADLLPP